MTLLNTNAEVLLSLGYNPRVKVAPRRIDFSLVFPNEQKRAEAIPCIIDAGFDCEISEDGVDPDWPEADAHKFLTPSAEAITDAEFELDELLLSFGGRTDGWGFFGDTKH